MTNPTILVTGATGNVGRALVAELKTTGAQVFAGSTGGAPVDGVPGRKVDFGDPASLRAAFAGIDTAFLLFPLVPGKLQLARNAVAAAAAAGVKHLVRSSGAGADPASAMALSRLQGQIDQIVIDSGLPYTLLRPNSFMQNFIAYYAGMIKAGAVYLSHGDGKISYIDVRDIATVAATILRDPAPHAGQAYTLTGPEAIDNGEALALIAQAAGRPVSYVPVPEEAAVKSMRDMGMDDWTVENMSSLNRIIAAGHASGVSPAVEAITGRKPRSFAEFVSDNADAWR